MTLQDLPRPKLYLWKIQLGHIKYASITRIIEVCNSRETDDVPKVNRGII